MFQIRISLAEELNAKLIWMVKRCSKQNSIGGTIETQANFDGSEMIETIIPLVQAMKANGNWMV